MTGALLACLVYLWGNRLLPAAVDARIAWETGLFFTAWLLALLHALWRPAAAVWREQLYLAGLLAVLLPVLDLLSGTGTPDAIRQGVDLTAFVCGGLLLICGRSWFRAESARFGAPTAGEVRTMTTGGLVMAVLSLIVTGMACLAMGMEGHFVALRARAPDEKTLRNWRAGGWLLLGLALLPCLAGWPIAIGIVLWIGLTAGGVLIVALVLAFARR